MKLFIAGLLLLLSVQVQASQALRLAKYSCKRQKISRACYTYAVLLRFNGFTDKAKKEFKGACSLGEKRACQALNEKWEPPKKKVAKAVAKIKKSGPKVEPDEEKIDFSKQADKIFKAQDIVVKQAPKVVSAPVVPTVPVKPATPDFEVRVGEVEKDESDVDLTSSDLTCIQKVGGSIRANKEVTCEQQHPIMRNFTVKHHVKVDDNNCEYTQTMPGNGLMRCNFDEDQRKSFSVEMSKRDLASTLRKFIGSGECSVSSHQY
jgi:hypothetical protein